MANGAAKPKVLVVDDERVIADTLAIILNQHGYEASAVYTGTAAVERARVTRPDLVISDVIMPEMTGPELIRHLKANYERDFAVLFVTGYVGEGESDELRGYELLRKPFTVGALASAVSAALARVATEQPGTSAAGAKG